MAGQKFTLDEALSFGWKTMIENIGGLLLYIFLPWLFLFSLSIGSKILVEQMHLDSIASNVLHVGTSLIQIVLQVIFSIAVIKICLKYIDKQPVSISDFIPTMNQFWCYLAGGILNTLVVTVGFICLIVPGIIFGIMFQFFGFLIIDKGLGPIQALKGSAILTKGTKIELLILWVLLGVISFVGFLCLVIGLIPAAFMWYMTFAYVYRKCLSLSDLSEVTGSMPPQTTP